MNVLQKGLKPRDILTRQAFENAIASVAATGGSTNAVLHLLAIAREAGVPLEIDDFQTVSERTPLLADLKPSGRFVAADMHRAGGIRLLAKRLLEGKYLHGSAKTVTGQTIADEAKSATETPGQEVIVPLEQAAESDRRAGDSQGQSCTRRMRDEDQRPRTAAASRAGASIRIRRRRHGSGQREKN